ncbi:MAG: DUF2442 domain-containing protein [Xanthomonadales bacterium]|nr:DUF2442 domain-containing protein [Xanthomonadales bacterium]
MSIPQPQFHLVAVDVTGPCRLSLRFADGHTGQVELTDIIERHPSLSRLRHRDVFATVAADEWRRGIIFAGDDSLALASDNLRALSLEQAGQYSHQQVIAWMHRNGLSLAGAATALGLSRRMLAYYRSGRKPVPKTVGLAMLGWEHRQASDRPAQVA